MQPTMIFTFEDLDNGTAVKKIKEFFEHAGADVIEVNADPRIRRTSGVSFRSVSIVFADGQTVTLSVKQTGDVYQAALNGKLVPIHNQESEAEAALQLVKLMDAGRTKFQAALARTKAQLPASIRTPVPKQEVLLKQQHEDLDRAIAEGQAEISDLKKQLVDAPALDSADWSENVDSKWQPPEGFFDQDAAKIASGLADASDGEQQAMDRLDFYINRGGDNLSSEDKERLDKAKSLLHEHYGHATDGAGYNDDPDPDVQELGDHKETPAIKEYSAPAEEGKEPRYGDKQPVPEKTETVAQNDEQEKYEDRAQQYDISKRYPAQADADKAISANEDQAAQSNSTTSPDAGKQGDDEKDAQLTVSGYY